MKLIFTLLLIILTACGSTKKYSKKIVGTWQITKIETKDGHIISEEPFYNEYHIYQNDNLVIHQNTLINAADTGHWEIKDEILYGGNLKESLKPYGRIISLEHGVLKVIQLTTPDSTIITYSKEKQQ